jgi:hypothetical protein
MVSNVPAARKRGKNPSCSSTQSQEGRKSGSDKKRSAVIVSEVLPKAGMQWWYRNLVEESFDGWDLHFLLIKFQKMLGVFLWLFIGIVV